MQVEPVLVAARIAEVGSREALLGAESPPVDNVRLLS